MTDNRAEVVSLFPDAEASDHDQPITTRPKDHSKPYCRHRRTELDHETHRVYCRDCGTERDAFAVLCTFAADPERYIRQRKEAARMARDAGARLAELQRRERNAKARVRKWGAKAGEASEQAVRDVLSMCARVAGSSDPELRRFAEHVAWYARKGLSDDEEAA